VIVRLHIERLVVDEGVLARGERAGLAQAIELEVGRRLAGSRPPAEARRRDAAPAHVQAIGAGIVERIPAAPGERSPRAGGGAP
jgi:hypothetical protein